MRMVTTDHILDHPAAVQALKFLDGCAEAASRLGLPAPAPYPGYFLDVPDLSKAADSIAERVRTKAAKRGEKPDVRYDAFRMGDKVVVRVGVKETV